MQLGQTLDYDDQFVRQQKQVVACVTMSESKGETESVTPQPFVDEGDLEVAACEFLIVLHHSDSVFGFVDPVVFPVSGFHVKIVCHCLLCFSVSPHSI